MTYTKTTRLGLKLIDFDTVPWHEDTNDNWTLLDSVVSAVTGVSGIEGSWQNSLAVVIGQKFVDNDDLSVWEVLVSHTTEAVGSFEDERTLHPTYWGALGFGLRARGEWVAGTYYAAGDLAFDESEGLYCVCTVNHTASGPDLRTEIPTYWAVMLDASVIPAVSTVSYGVAQTLTVAQKKQAKDNIHARGELRTKYTVNGTHNFDPDCRRFKLIAVGGGGGAGGAKGDLGTYKASAGGNSGFYGETDIMGIGAVTTATIVIGNGGSAGVGVGSGGFGGDTTYTDGTNSFTWPGGDRTVAATISSVDTYLSEDAPDTGTVVGTIYGMTGFGREGHILQVDSAAASPVKGGAGGSTPLGSGGSGGRGTPVPTANGAYDGENGQGFGGGGGGAATNNTASNADGGAGKKGVLFVVEYF